MSIKQLPIPGLEGYVVGDKMSTMNLIYLAHVGLANHMATIFEKETDVLRAMATLNDKECSEAIYIQQRKLCMAIRDVVGMLEDMSDGMETSDNGE